MFKLEGNAKSYIRSSFNREEISALSQSEIYISGGSGFSGRWIVTVLQELLEPEKLPKVTLVSRSPEKARMKFMKCSNLSVISWRNLELDSHQISLNRKIIAFHASVPAASGEIISSDEITKLNSLTETFALLMGKNGNPPIFVNLSSGTVYDRPLSGVISEIGGKIKTSSLSSYDIVKFADEEIVSRLRQAGKIIGVNPRLFSFTGPGIEIPGKFALGSFVFDALEGRKVKVTGNENSLRSYMAPIDLGIWLLKASIYPTDQPIHIGSSQGLKMSQIATFVSSTFGKGQIEISTSPNSRMESYVPETIFSQKALNISNTLDFSSSLSFWKSHLN